MLLVITGASGTGKDSVANEILKHPALAELNLKRLITCADRPPRPGETEGVDYYFVTPKELDEMYKKEQLVEKPQTTGTSRKGTPRKEFTAILKGEKRLWRIDPFLASKVATGIFFEEQFEGREKEDLKSLTTVVCVASPKEQIEGRRKLRDREKYNTKEYKLRDLQEKPNLDVLQKESLLVQNLNGQLGETVKEVANIILKNYAKGKERG